MAEHVSAVEIADLMRRIRSLQQQHPIDLVEQAAVLVLKAELLARITQSADRGMGTLRGGAIPDARGRARGEGDQTEDANRAQPASPDNQARPEPRTTSPRCEPTGRQKSRSQAAPRSGLWANHGWPLTPQAFRDSRIPDVAISLPETEDGALNSMARIRSSRS